MTARLENRTIHLDIRDYEKLPIRELAQMYMDMYVTNERNLEKISKLVKLYDIEKDRDIVMLEKEILQEKVIILETNNKIAELTAKLNKLKEV